MSDHVTIVEMSPRDGLQNEAKLIPTSEKIKLINELAECGFEKIEVTSFVSPKWVPQMADASEVLTGITRNPNTLYTALTPNLRGFEAAIAAGADEVAVFASASEGFSEKNINCSISESIERFIPLLRAAEAAHIPVRGYVSCVTDCPYDGPTSPKGVASVTSMLLDLGCYEVSLGDTIGQGTRKTVSSMLEAVLLQTDPKMLAGHFHDTTGNAIDNILTSVDYGLRVFDSSVGGLGGCPYAPGAKGNVATETVVAKLHELGFETGINAERLAAVAAFAQTLRSTS